MTQEQHEQMQLIQAAIYHLNAFIECDAVGVFISKQPIMDLLDELNEAKETMYDEFEND